MNIWMVWKPLTLILWWKRESKSVKKFNFSEAERYLIVVVFSVFVIIAVSSNVYADTVVKTISGQAVLTDGVEKARKESINDALGEALNSYIYDDLAVNHKFEPQIDEIIIKNRNRYIKKFAIQNEHTLGELYQIELRIELKRGLIERDLKKIEKPEKLKVKNLLLVFLASKTDSAAPAADSDDNETELSTQVLKQTALERELKQELAVYGFTLSGADELTPELKSTMSALLDAGGSSALKEFNSAWFKGLFAGDLLIVVRPGAVREERIVSLRKSFWQSQAEIIFIDMKNAAITRLPMIETKIVGDDYVLGMERLSRELSDKVSARIIDRLLRDYVVPGGNEARIELQCLGFRQPSDFTAFKERLQALRTINKVVLKELTAGSLTIEISTLSPAELLGEWLNNTAGKNLNFHLNATLLPWPAPPSFSERPAGNNSLPITPRRYLVQVIYDGAPDSL